MWNPDDDATDQIEGHLLAFHPTDEYLDDLFAECALRDALAEALNQALDRIFAIPYTSSAA